MFEFAKPIWLKNSRTTKIFRLASDVILRLTNPKNIYLKFPDLTFYRIFLNGEFVGYGPARAGHGYLRYDEISLAVKDGLNKLAIEVAGYNCSSFYTLPIESFLCAEIYRDEEVIKFTGRDFSGLSLEGLRCVRSCRYSYQRAYGEVWSYDNGSEIFRWTTSDKLTYDKIYSFDILQKFIPRGLPLPCYDIIDSVAVEEFGVIRHKNYQFTNARYLLKTSNNIDGYFYPTIEDKTVEELYGDFIPGDKTSVQLESVHISSDNYCIYRMPINKTGFIINRIKALTDCNVYIFFSEYNYGNGMIFDAICSSVNIIKYKLSASDEIYELESFEPYTCKYIGVAVVGGEAVSYAPGIREYCYPVSDKAVLECSDGDICGIFGAAAETFRQSTLDVFMDCPSRERGGWLCDSYFSAKSERFFTGKNDVEKVFLDNFLMAEDFPNLPYGMIPMVYPSEIIDYRGGYIPQWALWYIIELGDSFSLRDDRDAEPFRELCYNIIGWFKKYENEDGLLEKMPGWNFVEWSVANDWVQDVNYPTNMLYFAVLSTMARLFGDDALSIKASELRDKIIQQSFDGDFFNDNAVRDENGALVLTHNRSETCQYYAYFFGIADFNDSRFEKLSKIILDVFGPFRDASSLPEIARANAFVGNYLRLIILLRSRRFSNVISDVKGYFTKMVEITGTLWENADLEASRTGGSLCHCFASFAGVAVSYALAGISEIDYNGKEIFLDKSYLSEVDFSLTMTCDDGEIIVREQNGRKEIVLPHGWKLR